MSDQPGYGEFCWNELATTDSGKCMAFYENLFGWKAKTEKFNNEPYTLFYKDGKQICGMRTLSDQEKANTPPHWSSYVAVNNVDEQCERVVSLEGEVIVPPMDIPNVGRFAFVRDPAGAVFAVFQSKK